MSKIAVAAQALAAGSMFIGSVALAQTADTSRTPGQVLFDNGVSLSVNYTGEAATNPSGGIRQSTDYAGQIYFGADFDFARIAGLDGTSAHVAMTQRHGRNLASDAIGNNTSVQEIYGTQNLHLANLTVEQKLFDGRLDVTAGRTVANVAFLNSPIYCNFQSNSTCGNPTFIFKDSNFTYFPASSWGGDAKALLTDKIYLHAGAYEVNPHDKTTATHGFDFGTDNATGTTIPFELGYETSFANDSLPRHYQIGGWYDDSDYADPLLDAGGNVALLSGNPYATNHGRSGGFFRFDQMIWRPDSASKRGLTLFGIAMTRVSGRVTEDRFYELGLLQTGTFADRDEDTLGFMVNDQQFSESVLAGIRAARQSAGGNGSIPKHEVMMELAYGAQVTSAIRFSPNLQYIVNPDQTAEPFRTKNIPDAFVVGFKFTVDLAKIVGLAPPSF